MAKNLATFSKIAEKFFLKTAYPAQCFMAGFHFFGEGRTSMRDKPRPGRPTEAVTPTLMRNAGRFLSINIAG